jgi:DNA-binding protein HU-beta
MARRTTHRSRSGKKLYAVRDASGRFKDIQTYERAHGQDIKRGSAAEKKAKAKAKAKTAVKKKKAAPRRKKAAAKKK